jgi:S1-C subfamily serine protease
MSERRQQARTLFAPLGPTYDRMGALLSLGQDPLWRRFLVSRLPQRGHVLDVATGTGLVAAELLRRGFQVTALDQTITANEGGSSSETLSGMIQSDALIYEGDSGGALVNKAGQVVGMITAGQAQGFRSSASDVGYAIAANTAVSQANRIRAHEQGSDLTYGQWGFLGVVIRDTSSGPMVTSVQSSSPAAAAGIAPGSIINKIGSTTITSSDSLGNAIRAHEPGDRVSVTWSDSSGSHTATVTLAGINP